MSRTGRIGLRLMAVGALVSVAVGCLPGCEWRGLNSLPLPGTQGKGPGSFVIKAQLPDVGYIEPNSRVRVGDANVGTITKIERESWHALVTMRLNGDVDLPANGAPRSARPACWARCTWSFPHPPTSPHKASCTRDR